MVQRRHEASYDAYADVTHRVIAAVSCSATPPPPPSATAAAAAAVNRTSHERLVRGRRGAVKTRCLRSVKAQLTF